MEKELGIIDSILGNLVAIRRFYEHERGHLTKFIDLSEKLTKDTLIIKELAETNEIFETEAKKELEFFKNKLLDVEQKIEILDKDIALRKQSKEKLVDLFNSLKTINSFDEQIISKNTVKTDVVESFDDLPIMEIREELDDNGSILSSQMKPYENSNQLNEIFEKINKSQEKIQPEHKNAIKSQKNANINEEIDENGNIIKSSFRLLNKELNNMADVKTERGEDLRNKSKEVQKEEFRPFMIREEIDEEGNVIESSVERIPSIQKNGVHSIEEDNEEVDEDQLSELFADMGFQEKKILEAVDSNPHHAEKQAEEHIELVEEVEDKTEAPRIQPFQYQSNIDPNDLLTLELLADQIDDEGVGDEGDFDEEWELEGTKYFSDEDDDPEEEQDDIIQQRAVKNMFGGRAGDLFMQKVLELRKSKYNDDGKATVATVLQSEDKNTQVSNFKFENKKPKKSVSFNNTVNIKQVDNIWDDIRKSEVENEVNFSKSKNEKAISRYKMARMESQNVIEKPQEGDQFEENDEIMLDVVERPANTVLSADSKGTRLGHDVFKTFNPIELKKQLEANMPTKDNNRTFVKLSRDRTPSRFKMARAAEMGKVFQSTHITKDVYEHLQEVAQKMIAGGEGKEKFDEESKKSTILNKQLRSLKPLNPAGKKNLSAIVINAPKEDNPLILNPSYNDEDYEIIRSEINEDLFDDDDEGLLDEYIAEKVLDIAPIDSSVDKASQPPEKNPSFPEFKNKHDLNEEKVEALSTELDYNNLQYNIDTMAKAYVLGLYDDDIETQGQVIEELNDFEEHNNTVEAKESSRLHNRVTEINNLAEGIESTASNTLDDHVHDDDGPMVATNIIEHDIIEVNESNAIPDDDLDIELNDESLNSRVSLDYSKLRTRMIHKYKGGFKKTEKEKEFEPLDGTKKISRFKAARLGL